MLVGTKPAYSKTMKIAGKQSQMANQVLARLRKFEVTAILAGAARILGGGTAIVQLDADVTYKSGLLLIAILLACESFPAILKIAQEHLGR